MGVNFSTPTALFAKLLDWGHRLDCFDIDENNVWGGVSNHFCDS